MSDRANLVRVLTASTGTATMTLGAAYSQLFMTSAEAGMVDGRTYTYLIVDGNNWELGKGVYTASGTTLSRVTVLASRISGTLGTTKITLTGTAQVRIVESADDMGALRGTRAVTGTTDTIANNDLGRAITYSNASAIAASLAQAGASSQFLDGWCVHVKNTGAGVLTITPATSTINGGSTLVLAQNMGAFIWSDGTNYHAYFYPVTKPLLAANNLADVADAATARGNLAAIGTGDALGSAQVATQTDQEAASSTTLAVTPGRQVFHPSALKAWVKFNGTGTPAITVGHNASSITDNGTGDWTVNWTTAFSSADYCIGCNVGNPSSTTSLIAILERNGSTGAVVAATSSSVRVNAYAVFAGGTATDSERVYVFAAGDR